MQSVIPVLLFTLKWHWQVSGGRRAFCDRSSYYKKWNSSCPDEGCLYDQV